MDYRIRLTDGKVSVTLLKHQQTALTKAAQILTDLHEYGVYDTSVITPDALQAIVDLAGGKDGEA